MCLNLGGVNDGGVAPTMSRTIFHFIGTCHDGTLSRLLSSIYS